MRSICTVSLFVMLFVLSGCVSTEQATQRAQIYADTQNQRSYNEMKAREADAQAIVDKEYARQEGMTNRVSIISNTLPIMLMLLIFGTVLMFGIWAFWQHKVELAKSIRQPRVIYLPTTRDILDYANTVDAELSADSKGYVLKYPRGRVERLLPMRNIRE